MEPINEIFSLGKVDNNSFLRSSVKGNKKSKRSTSDLERVPLDELELAYMNNALTFNSANKIIQTMFNWGTFEIESQDKDAKEFLEDFTKTLGDSGSLITWDELKRKIGLDLIKFGKSFVEKVYNKKGNRIVDWDPINTTTMEYALDRYGNIALDEEMKPVGYFQVLPDSYIGTTSNQELPEEVVTPMGTTKYVFLENKYVGQIKLYEIGDGFYPMGLIESSYRDNVRKMGVKEMIANSAEWHGYPIIVGYLGNDRYLPNSQQVEDVAEDLKKLDFKKQIAVPYYYKIEMLESSGDSFKNSDILLKMFEGEEVAGMGVPKNIAKNTDDGSGTAVMRHNMMTFHLTIKDIAQRMCSSIRKELFKPLMELEGYETVPELKFTFISPEEMDIKARRLSKFVDSGILKPDEELSNKIKKLENI